MDNQEFYNIGKSFYYDNKHEDLLENSYLLIDDLLDNFDNKQLEIRFLIEEQESIPSENLEERKKELYEELSSITNKIDLFEKEEIKKYQKEILVFKAKNKYKFIELEMAEQNYVNSIKSGKFNSNLELDNLKKMKLDILSFQEELDKIQKKLKKAQKPLLILQEKRKSILKEISEIQNLDKKNNSDFAQNINYITDALKQKKTELDKIKESIRKTFIKIGSKIVSENLK